MRFRPCIDIHNGKVKQIVGGSLQDLGDKASENFVSVKDSAYYAKLFKSDHITGAHVILLNGKESEYYEATKEAAFLALRTYMGGLQVGGGITAANAVEYIEAGASHVIVTSFIFSNGALNYDNLKALKDAVGKEHVVLDLSARFKDGSYYVVTDRWQTFTNTEVTARLFKELSEYCDEFLVHGVDVEGKKTGIDENLLKILSEAANCFDVKITYAGGIASYSDIDRIEEWSEGKIDFTVGSALDLYGGILSYKDLTRKYNI